MASESTTPESDYVWQVTFFKGKPVSVKFGDELAPYTDATKARTVGKMLITLGTRLVQINEDDLDDEWGDDDE